jgi:O-acetyl-ADP-ribose deacetylase (regulator of RNase III)
MKTGGAFGTDFETSAEQLAAKVQEHISLGWEPIGGVAVGETGGMKTPYLFQAMIKRR